MPRRPVPLLQDAIDTFRADRSRRGYARLTLADYDVVFRRMIKELGNCRLDKITPYMITDFVTAWVTANKLKPGTTATKATKIHSFGRFCFDRGWTTYPDWTEDLGAVAVYRQTFTRLTVDQLARALEVNDNPRDRVLVNFAGFTGLRIGEIRTLRIKDLDLDNCMVRVVRSKKRGDSGIERFPLVTELVEAIKLWLEAYQAECGELNSDWYLIPTRAGRVPTLVPTKAISHGALNIIANRTFKRAGIEKQHGEAWHVFRRSMARLYYDSLAGESGAYNPQALRRVQALLGHKRVSTTEGYLGLDVDRAARDADLAGQSFFSLAKPATWRAPFELVEDSA